MNLVDCGICGGEHPAGFAGDCRDDAHRYPKTELPAFKITYANGQTTSTSMARGVTLADAQKYFIGNFFDLGSGWGKDGEPLENLQRAVRVEEINAISSGS
jgi:hypothetical protein